MEQPQHPEPIETRRKVRLNGGPARDYTYTSPRLPAGLGDPPRFLYLRKPHERGGYLAVWGARLATELYELDRDYAASHGVHGMLDYAHVPDSVRGDYRDAELAQVRLWCQHKDSAWRFRAGGDGAVYCLTCEQEV